MNRTRYFLREDVPHAVTYLRILLKAEDQTNSGKYLCVMSNRIGSTNIKFQVISSLGSKGKNVTGKNHSVTEKQGENQQVDTNMLVMIGEHLFMLCDLKQNCVCTLI